MRNAMKHLFPVLLALSVLAGCGNREEGVSHTEEVTEAVTEVTSEPASAVVTEPAQTAAEATQMIDLSRVEAYRPSYEMLQNYAASLQEYNDRLREYYSDERIPASREFESYTAKLDETLEDIKAIGPNDISDEDCEKLIQDLKQTETEMDDLLREMEVTIEDAPTQQTVDAVNYNYETLIIVYNNLLDYFAQDERLMSEEQRAAMIEARRRIDRYDDIYFEGITRESELIKLNDELVEDINFLNDIAETTM